MSDNDNDKSNTFKEFITSVIENNNFNYSASLSDYKSIKINALNISKLMYNNMII